MGAALLLILSVCKIPSINTRYPTKTTDGRLAESGAISAGLVFLWCKQSRMYVCMCMYKLSICKIPHVAYCALNGFTK